MTLHSAPETVPAQPRTAIGVANEVLRRIEMVTDTAAVVLMLMIMLIVAGDVAMRYVFNNPFGWAYDLVSLYLMVALFFLVLSVTFAQHGHISVDILQNYLPTRWRHACEVVACGGAAVLFALIAYAGADRTLVSFTNHEVVGGVIPWPTWLSVVFVPIGAALLSLRLALHCVAHVLTLATGRQYIGLPPVVGSDEAIDRGMGE